MGKGPSQMQKKRHISRKTRDSIVNIAIQILLAVLSLIWVLPIVGIVIGSFHCSGANPDLGTIHTWGLDNYVRLFRETMFLKWFGNTLLVGMVTAIVQTAFQLAVGYSFSRFRFRGRKFLMCLLYVLSMLPGSLTLIVLNGWLHAWNLTGANAPYGAILVYTASSGLGYSIIKGYYDTVDRSITEAAEVDGATQLQIFYRIYLPIGKPIIIYTLLMGFLLPWSDPSIVDAVLPGFMVGEGMQWIMDSTLQDNLPTFCAGSVVISVPIVTLFLLLQKYYLTGETIRVTGKPPHPVE